MGFCARYRASTPQHAPNRPINGYRPSPREGRRSGLSRGRGRPSRWADPRAGSAQAHIQQLTSTQHTKHKRSTRHIPLASHPPCKAHARARTLCPPTPLPHPAHETGSTLLPRVPSVRGPALTVAIRRAARTRAAHASPAPERTSPTRAGALAARPPARPVRQRGARCPLRHVRMRRCAPGALVTALVRAPGALRVPPLRRL